MDDHGYIMVALLVGIAIASIWMTAALPSWRQQAIREKETELIFRGEQYARAILQYQQKMNGALPTSFDDLISQQVLRKKWKDPMTGQDFLPRVGCVPGGTSPPGGGPGTGPVRGGPSGGGPATGPPRGGPIGGAGTGPAPAPPIRRELFANPQIGMPAPAPQRGTVPQPTMPTQRGQVPSPGGQFPGGGQPMQGGICGVQSSSKAASIKIYNGQQQYDLWQFDLTTATRQVQLNVQKLGGAVAPGGSLGLPMIPGRGGLPGPGGTPGTGGRGLMPGSGRGGGGPGGPGTGTGPGRGFQPGGIPQQPPMPFPGPGRGRG